MPQLSKLQTQRKINDETIQGNLENGELIRRRGDKCGR